VGDGNVLEHDVELLGALEKLRADQVGDLLTLGDKLGGVEAGNDSLEDLVSDGGKNTLVIVLSQVLQGVSGVPEASAGAGYLVDLGEVLDVGTVEDTKGQRDHLQVLGSGGGRDVAGLSADIVDDGTLQPRNEEVSSLVNNLQT
jgi:hypothetical protein